MNHLEKEVAPLSTFESKLIKENQNLLKKLDQQTQRITQQDQQITEQTLKIQQLTEQVEFLTKKLFGSSSEKTKVDPNQLSLFEDPQFRKTTKQRLNPQKKSRIVDVRYPVVKPS